uniref:Rho-GAP domain-containing protein n=1 Tax=Petromyzon marinus TaxID=7757 RepID=S4R5C8_PETMA
GLESEGLFRVSGSVRAVERLRQAWEADVPEAWRGQADVSSVAGLLKLFLRELPDGVVPASLLPSFLQAHRDSAGDEMRLAESLRLLLAQLPGENHALLRYLCSFLVRVAQHQEVNLMSPQNLGTVFGPNFFRVSPGMEGIAEQQVVNRVTARFITDFLSIFQEDSPRHAHIILVQVNKIINLNSCCGLSRSNIQLFTIACKRMTDRTPRASAVLFRRVGCGLQNKDAVAISVVTPLLPQTSFPYILNITYLNTLLEQTIASTVEQHLFDTDAGDEGGGGGPWDAVTTTAAPARPRRRQLRSPGRAHAADFRDDTNKVNMPASEDPNAGAQTDAAAKSDVPKKQRGDGGATSGKGPGTPDDQGGLRAKRQRSNSKRGGQPAQEDGKRWRALAREGHAGPVGHPPRIRRPTWRRQVHEKASFRSHSGHEKASFRSHSGETDVPLLDLAGIAPDTEWGEPVRLFRDWRSESSEPHLSPRPGRLIRRLLADEADPLLSPRCSSFSHSQRYHTDPEAPPSPPNLPSFMRPRSSSLGSREEEHDKEEVTSSQLSKRIQSLKKKIRRFEERFQEEHRYRPSHSDKVTNPEVLKWMNDLARSRKQLRDTELRLKQSQEETLSGRDALTRQRSNTLPRSFGSSRPCELSLPTAEKPRAERPTVEQTMEAIELRLKEKRQQAARPDSPKEMTREQIAAEKVAIQKSLLYFESIHGRPTTRQEKHKVKPLYDRYRSVKTLLVRARAIPIITNRASQEEEEGTDEEDDGKAVRAARPAPAREPPLPAAPTAAAPVTTATPPPFAPRRLLPEDEEQDTDGFVSPLEESCGSSCKLARVRPDPSLSTLHAASREELMEHLRTTRSDKRRLRKLLRDFEDSFYRHTGRNVAKEDRSTLAEQYTEYKHAKAKLRLLEALIGKQGTSAVTV